MDIEAQFRDFARRGFSKRETAKTLELSDYMLEKLLSAMGPIKWPSRGCSNNHRRANEARRGVPNPANKIARAVQREAALHTVDGVTGTIDELAAKIGKVSGSRVRIRMKVEGMTLEQALKTPRQHGNRFKKPLRNMERSCTAN